MSPQKKIYGLIAEFDDSERVLEAAKEAFGNGYRNMDAYTPFPVDGLAEALGRRKTVVPLIVLSAAICGAIGGYFLQWYALAVDYPINVGGRPFNSWPAYIPITFELMVLCASTSAIIAMLALNRLPQPHHPVFNAPGFERASVDRFFLCIEASDAKFDLSATRQFLERLWPKSITEVRE
jgi:hypothetical protein